MPRRMSLFVQKVPLINAVDKLGMTFGEL